MNVIRFCRRVYLAPFGEDGGGGGEPPSSDVAAPAPVAAPAVAEVAPAPVAAAPVAAPAPKSMLDAINKGMEQKAAVSLNAPRDPSGKFVPKVAADVPGEPAAAPVKAVDPLAEADPDAMPEGLGQKAQERFQRLANERKELTQKVDSLDRQVSYVRDTFSTHGIKQDQFEQAASVIGMINKGDFDGAQRVLQHQLQQLAVMSGKPLQQVDALANFPDLHGLVDTMQVSEEVAMELARGRSQQQAMRTQQERTQQVQQTQHQEQQVVQQGTSAVDAFCKRMQASDLDYSAIEAQLLPEIPTLLEGVPPQRWAAAVEAHYRLIKKVAGTARQSAPAIGSNPLRATGHGSPQQAPRSMHEAMWGATAPR